MSLTRMPTCFYNLLSFSLLKIVIFYHINMLVPKNFRCDSINFLSLRSEICCYISYFGSSFNDKPVHNAASGPMGMELFEREQSDLLSDLKDIPKKACDRRVSF